ncbi:sigma-70 family RNA polymerase sigma factor [Pseudactinotalea sp. HY160]|uniref:RNA polymerase sigma factor n=1 Tax=Pseudactinotalea sp. HY160 TaxID=2654490 RepID=UPI001313D08A|nr:sigma-70 family RNA polymerase sigma factor [Pseudactinotalea sp. HY160]
MRTTQQPFEHAVTGHGVTVLRVCRAVLGPGADAEDAWSETFLAALRAWPDLEEGANVEAWLVRIARRKAIDVIRARDRRAIPTETLPEPPARAGTGGSSGPGGSGAGGSGSGGSSGGDPGGDAAIDSATLWGRVAALPERQRLALGYHYLGGLAHTETAQLIGGTPESVRRAAADGIRRLRTIYHDEGGSR